MQEMNTLNLREIDEVLLSHGPDGSVCVETYVPAEIVHSGETPTARILLAGLDVRVDEEENIQVHSIIKGNDPYVAFIDYINFTYNEDGGCSYDGVKLSVHSIENMDNIVEQYEFDRIRDALIYIQENYVSYATVTDGEVTSTSSTSMDNVFNEGKSDELITQVGNKTEGKRFNPLDAFMSKKK